MVQRIAQFVLKNSTDDKGGRTAPEIGTGYLLGLGKREPVRQLKKAGVIFISVQQHLQIHNSGRKVTKTGQTLPILITYLNRYEVSQNQ